MGAFVSIIWEAFVCPVTTVLCLINCWVWVKIFMEEWDPRQLSLSYNDVVGKKQYWRVITAPLTHSNIGLLLLDTTVLWNCRLIELNKGPLFFLRYSLLLMVSEAVMSFVIIHRAISLQYSISSAIAPLISNLNTYNSSGFLLAWLTYQSFECRNYTINKNFVLLGVMGFHVVFAGFVMALIYSSVSPRNNFLSNMAGILSGCLLSSGITQILPSFFWSFCFVLNVFLVVIASAVAHYNVSLPSSTNETNSNLLTVVNIQGESAEDQPDGSDDSARLRGSEGSDNEAEGDGDNDDEDDNDDDEDADELHPLIAAEERIIRSNFVSRVTFISSGSSGEGLRGHRGSGSNLDRILDFEDVAV